MKHILFVLALTAMAFTPPVEQPSVVKSIRMTQLEDNFGLKITGILRDGKTDYWIFMEGQTGTLLNMFPVVIKKDASNHDMEVAKIAAENCASFYEVEIRKAKGHSDAFTMPTHPPQVAQR